MKPGDTVYIEHQVTKKEKSWCRAQVKEVHGPVLRLSVWTGKAFVNRNAMKSEVRLEKPDS